MKTKKFNSIGFAISGVMFFTLIGKALGFIRELILAYFFGAGMVSDAYLISQTIPGTLFQVVGTGITSCFVPVYLRLKNQNSNKKQDFTNKFISMILLVSTILIFIVMFFTKEIVKIFAVGFDNETLNIAIVFTRISIITLYASGFVYVYNALLQAEKKFVQAAFAVIPYNIGLILAIILGAKWRLYSLAYVSALAVIIQLVYQIFFVRKIPYKYSVCFRLNDVNIKSSLKLLPPVILGVAATEINTLVDRTVASSIMIGGITIITYGTSLFNLVVGIFSQSISSVFYPSIAEAAIENDKKKLEAVVQKATNMALYFLIPITFGMIALSSHVVTILFAHGDFSKKLVTNVSGTVVFYSLGFAFYAIKQVINNLFYAKQKTKTPMINTIIGIIANVLLNIFLSKIIGLNGLALATSISSIIIGILMVISAKQELHISTLPSMSIILKYIICAGIMYFICKMILAYIQVNVFLQCLVACMCGVMVYLGLTKLLGINIITNLRRK